MSLGTLQLRDSCTEDPFNTFGFVEVYPRVLVHLFDVYELIADLAFGLCQCTCTWVLT